MKDYSINDLISDKITGEWGDELTDSDGTKILRTTNFTNEGRLNFASVVERKIKSEIVEKKKLLPGDIIVEKSGGSPNQPVGRVVYFDVQNETYLCNNFTAVLRPSNKVYPKYLFYALFNFHLTNRTLRYQNKTTGILNLKLERYLNEERISLPPFDTQQTIAQILSEADIARQLRKQANALTDQFLQSTFLNMFGDPVNNPKGWKTETILNSGSKVQIGPFGTQLHVEDYVEGGIPLINPTHIQNSKIKEDNKFTITPEKFDELSNYHLVQGDIIMGRRGEMGRCALVTQREHGWLCGTGSLFIRPSKKLDSLYLLNVLTSKSFKETLEHEAKGVTMANLNKTIINNLLIPIPAKKLQQQFADIIADTEQLRHRQRAHEQELDQLFKGLLQKYFG